MQPAYRLNPRHLSKVPEMEIHNSGSGVDQIVQKPGNAGIECSKVSRYTKNIPGSVVGTGVAGAGNASQ
jgi:hypothetical protein